jgi:hypothetical protein
VRSLIEIRDTPEASKRREALIASHPETPVTASSPGILPPATTPSGTN